MSPPDRLSDADLPQIPAAASSSNAVVAVDAEAPPSSAADGGRVVAELQRFLGSRKPKEGPDYVRHVVIRKLYGRGKRKVRIDRELVDMLTQMAVVRALEAKAPPWTTLGVPGWVKRLTRRTIADYFRERKADDENLDRSEDAGAVPEERHAPSPDWGAREHLIAKYLESIIGDDPYRKRTFQLMMEKEVAGRSLDELAHNVGVTPAVLSSRFYKLRQELIPRVNIMDREKPRRAILLLIFLIGTGAVAFVVWLIVHMLTPQWASPPPAHRVHAPRAVVAPPPTLDNAQPTQPPSPPPEDDGNGKKTP